MKVLVKILVLTVGMVLMLGPQTAQAAVFADDFNYQGPIDPAKWHTWMFGNSSAISDGSVLTATSLDGAAVGNSKNAAASETFIPKDFTVSFDVLIPASSTALMTDISVGGTGGGWGSPFYVQAFTGRLSIYHTYQGVNEFAVPWGYWDWARDTWYHLSMTNFANDTMGHFTLTERATGTVLRDFDYPHDPGPAIPGYCLRFFAQPWGGPGSIQLDNMLVTPEPVSLLLMGVSGLLINVRRRRN